jgi:hypothetical protein
MVWWNEVRRVGRGVKQSMVALLICLGAMCCAPSSAQHSVPNAEEIWSVTLNGGASQGETSSDFAATRSAIIAGDRIVVVFEIGPTVFVGNRPKSTYRLLSLGSENRCSQEPARYF